MTRKAFVGLVILFGLGSLATGEPRRVPEDFTKIQYAIDAANTGDEVIVADGTWTGEYNRGLDFHGKSITVRSENGPANCIIDCQGADQAFFFHSGEDETSVVEGFTIIRGVGYFGGAIECSGSAPTIRDCIFSRNSASYYGGAIECYGASPEITNCLFYENGIYYAETYYGGAIDCEDASPVITNCTFSSNDVHHDGGGGAIFSSWNSSPQVVNCIFEMNSNHAIHEYAQTLTSDVTVTNCLFYDNFDGAYYDADTDTVFADNQINGIPDGFASNNIDGEPLFRAGPASVSIEGALGNLGEELGSFYLSQTDPIIQLQLNDSPALDAGSGSAFDIFGSASTHATRTDNVQDTGTVDIGYHYRNSGSQNYWLWTAAPDGHGTISPQCGLGVGDCLYPQYAEVALTATPDAGWKVSEWVNTDDDDSVDPYNIVTMDEDKTGANQVSVMFEQRPPCDLTVSIDNDYKGGRVRVFRPDGTYYGEAYYDEVQRILIDVQLTVYEGQVVRLEAVPDPNHLFKEWQGTDDDSSSELVNYVTVDSTKTVSAGFITEFVHLRVLWSPIDIGGVYPRSGDYRVGTQVELTASFDPCYVDYTVFWTGTDDDLSYEPTNTVTMDDNKTVSVQFTLMYWLHLSVTPGSDGWPHGVILDPATGQPATDPCYGETLNSQWYPAGDPVWLTAVPDAGYEVASWSNGMTGNLIQVTVSQPDTDVSVRFKQISQLPGNICVYPGTPDGEPDWAAGSKGCYQTIQDAIDDPNTLTGIYGPWVVEEDLEATPVPILGIPEAPGDVIVVADGEYKGPGNRDLDFNGKMITVRSEFGPENCIIDCEGTSADPHQGFVMSMWENHGSVLDGFTIRNGYADNGGAMSITGISSPLINNCIIENNNAVLAGGGLYFEGLAEDDTTYEDLAAEAEALAAEAEDAFTSAVLDDQDPCTPEDPCAISEGEYLELAVTAVLARTVAIIAQQIVDSIGVEVATLTNCKIQNNNAASNSVGNGGGIYCTNSSPVFIGTEISNNSAGHMGWGEGGGVYCDEASLAEFINCLIADNSSTQGGGGFQLDGGSDAIIQLCTVAGNSGGTAFDSDDGIVCDEESTPTISHCIVYHPFGNDLVNCEADEFSLVGQNPMFVTGQLNQFYSNGYYLSHVETEGVDSPAVDLGDGDFLGTLQEPPEEEGGYGLPFDLTTWIIDQWTGIPTWDNEPTDAGYHYPFWPGPPLKYKLTMYVIGNGMLEYSDGIQDGVVDPNTSGAVASFDPGTTVGLYAHPDCGYRVKYWYITGTDLSFAKLNLLTMYTLNQSIYHSDRTVVVEFEEVYNHYIEVPGEIPYIGIQDALDKAREGDTVVIAPGTYRGTGFTINKNITITGTEPSNPDVVANTVIDCAGELWGFILRGDTYDLYGTSCPGFDPPNVTLAGLTIINAHSGRLTAIDGLNPGDPGFNGGSRFGQGVIIRGSHTVVNCVIRNCTVLGNHGGNGADGEVGAVPGAPTGGRGGNAGDAAGAGIYVGNGNPLIKNCIIDGCVAEAGNAGNGAVGAAGSEEERAWPGGDGGLPGDAYGGGIYFDFGTRPTFIDCEVTNCIAYGGDGGNGGVGGDCPVEQSGSGPGGDGGVPGLAWGGGVYCGPGSDPNFMGLTISNCQAIGGQGGDGADAGDEFGGDGGFGGGTSYDYHPPTQDKPWKYSANGGGVYCGPDSDAVFTNCTFENNSTTGSISGIGGFSRPEYFQHQPRINYNIPSFGGGVYCAFPSSAVFSNCVVRGNETTFLNNQYTGYGGGLCFGGIEEPAPEWFDPITMQLVGDDPIESAVELNYCDIVDNASSVGGGIYITRADFDIADCNVVDNSSYRGGGIYSTQNIADILRCTIHGNIASQDAADSVIDPCLPGGVDTTLYGSGGGLYLFTTDANVSDCVISRNDAGGTGGGVYLGGNPEGISSEYYAVPKLHNCLITDNTAIKEGAGVSCNLAVESTISNCTIAGNLSIGAVSYGGGVCISTDSTAEVVDSIIWGNEGTNGSQLAVRSGDLYYPTPSNLDITYSDVHRPPVAEGLTGLDLVFCIDTTGSMYGDIEAVKESAVEITDLVAAQASDFRIAVVDYRDYPESPYGVPDLDYLYYDDLAFSSDQDEIVAAINAITLGAGSDWEESVYSALMHCIDGESLGGWRPGVKRAIILMADAPPHDPEPYGPGYTLNDVVSAALAGDATSIFTVLVRGDPTAATYFRSLAEGTGGTAFEVAGSSEVVDAIMQAIGLIGVESTHMYIEDECVLNGDVIYNFDPNTFIWVPGTHNIEEDPLFIGDYFLSQIAAGQLVDSNCVDAGSDLAGNLGLGTYTTRTDSGPDAGIVDMGYHHKSFTVPQYKLTTQLISTIGGDIDPDHPTGVDYDWYTQVPLSISPAPPLGYRVKWSGTDDDQNTALTNTVTMDGDRAVVAEFEQYWYTLTVQVVGPGTVLIDPNGINNNHPPGAVVYLTADPDDGYRVKVWTGADIDPLWGTGTAKVTMDGNRTVIVEFEPDVSDNLLVPDEYATIEEAVEAASNGDTIILKRRDAAYTISNPDGIDFMGRNITIMSEKPHEPNCVAATVIDCQGSRYVSKRAFHFHSGEGRNSRIWGITIKNGFIPGAIGGGGVLPGYLIDPEADPADPDAVRSAALGASATGDGYGGAILCENGSSPTIENCVITRCSATGGQGGDGANGYYVPIDFEPPDGQWGGHAGSGFGNGYGGTVACRDGSNPAIINCIVTSNAARGGCGGRGGDGSQKEDEGSGQESWGGNGGGASGAGFGGAIYCDGTSSPAIVDCTFRDNVATSGLPGQGGLPGPGDALDPPAGNGATGSVTTFGDTAGGAAYYGLNSDPNFINCTFVKNEAYEVHLIYQLGFGLVGGYGYVETPIYTRGGALYSESDNVVTLDNCTFTEHLGGAVYSEDNSEVDIDNCVFRNNQSRPQISVSPADYDTSAYPSYYDDYYDTATAPAGAIDAGSNCEVHIEDCEFTSNYSHGDGGAIHSRSNAVVKNCWFGGNTAQANGGAVEAHDLDASMPLTVDFEACSFGGNEAMLGGAVFFQDFDAVFADCYFAGNRAQSGGGLFLVDGVVALAGGYIIDNHATGVVSASQATDEEAGRGGGVVCVTTIATIENCVISGNTAEGTYSYGGGVSFYGGSDIITHEVRNCLITGNRAGVAGGGISCRIFTTPEIANCTFKGNSAGSYGGGVFSDWTSQPQISDSIFAGCDRRAIYEEEIGDDAFVRYSLFHNNPNGDFYDADTGQGYNGADAINSVAGNDDNIDGDPLFVIGPLGDHYLDQSSSAAVDAGSDLAVNLGMDIYTTDPDPNNPDTGTVDIGYHYGDITNVPQYQLKVVLPSGHGTVEALYKGQTYYGTPAEPLIISAFHGAKITITAYPDEGYRMASWSGGTINDNSKELTNAVIITFNKRIEVRFEQPRTLWVGTILEDESHFTSIQHAIDAAVDGDVVVILPGEYTPATWGFSPYNGIFLYNKDIVLTTAQPADPDGVIINGYHLHLYDVGPDAIIEGITITRGRMNLYRSSPAIRNCKFMDSNWKGATVITPDGCAQDGGFGFSVLGGAIAMYQNSSPAVSNCIFENCSVEGGDGNQANDGCGEHPAGGDGGWPGRAYGGAVYCAYSSSPTFLDCLFANCSASGGIGGNGGNGNEDPPGYGGRGGGWTWPSFIEDNPFYWSQWDGWTYGDKYYVWLLYGYNNYDWETWGQWFDTSQWGSWEEWYAAYSASSSMYGQMTPYDSYEDYWEFSGYGGAVYCEYDSSPKFSGCTFENNQSNGGLSGIGGLGPFQPEWYHAFPDRNIRIENAGGAVYAANGSNPEFVECLFRGNSADTTAAPPAPETPPEDGDLNLLLPDDYYVSYGGGVAGEDNCQPRFTKCEFIDNEACMGGGVYVADSVMTIADCNFIDNTAYHGGGIQTVAVTGTITGSYINGNQALFDAEIVFDPNNPQLAGHVASILGLGGGYSSLSSLVDVIDCIITNNYASASGGGIYYGGSDENVAVEPLLSNSLLANNAANYDGGGVSSNWYAEPVISNCTIVDNTAILRGGGLSCLYYSNPVVTDSIIWGNMAMMGAQIAVGSGDPYGPMPSMLSVTYSDIGPEGEVEAFGGPFDPAAGLAVDLSGDAQTLTNTILGTGITASNFQYRGSGIASGTFTGGFNAGIGIETGIILTCGDASLAPGADPAQPGVNTSDFATGTNNLPGDADLDVLIPGYATNDAAVLEFDFVSKGGDLFFNYVFASEEYNEFTNSPFNDVFGFFLDGRNIALIPGTTTPVTINNVNGGNPYGTNASSPGLYNNNDISDGGPFYNIEYDGFTTVFTAKALNLSSGLHHIKLAIADASDFILDSAVFIQAGSFSDTRRFPPAIHIDDGCTLNGQLIYNWDPEGFSWDIETGNLEEDPLFIGDYYLSRIAAGQLVDSNCVDAGSDLAENIFTDPNMYTTRTDSVPDKYDGSDPCSALVDMGYHHRVFVVPQYKLTVTPLNIAGLPEINVSMDPCSVDDLYDQYTVVKLTVDSVPAGYQVNWADTDDDSVSDPVNYVTMSSNKDVRVSYTPQYHLTVTTIPVDIDGDGIPDGIDVTLEPDSVNGYYDHGTRVKITVANPPAGYDVLWTGTDNDTSTDPNNYVTMNSDREVDITYALNMPEYYALVCGISDYSGTGSDLMWPAYDADEFYLTLLDAPNWNTQNVTLLQNTSATKYGIEGAINSMAARLDDNDVFVFFFSGHGTTGGDIEPFDEVDGFDEYLVTYNFQNIRDDELGDWFAVLPTKNYIVFLDSCFAGGNAQGTLSPKGIGDAVSAPGDGFAADLVRTAGPDKDLDDNDAGVVVSACAEGQLAWESSELQHGVFTYYLLQAMRGKADYSDNGGNVNEWVSAEECYQYLAERVDNWALDAGVTVGQNPQLYDADQDNEIDFLSVRGESYEPDTWTVPGDYSNVQTAVNAAKDGDIIILSTGHYFGGDVFSPAQIIIDKEITLTSTNPDDPDIVEATVINCEGYASRGIYFTGNAGPRAVLDGITIANGTWFVIDAEDGEQPSDDNPLGHPDGYDGGWTGGGGILCGIGSSPTIRNCVIRDCYLVGGNAGNAADSEELYPAGNGGWGGAAYGGGVYIMRDASPTFYNSTIRNCSVTGGNGGNGGNDFEQDGFVIQWPGHGGNWSDPENPLFTWQNLGKIADYRYYSGYGGGVYCDQGSSPTFIGCTITDNTAQGGMSGIGGDWTTGAVIPAPVISYEIPAYGGGVYCAKNTTARFVNCTIANNTAVKPDEAYHVDPYLGHGGGVAFEETSSVTFVKCDLMENEASVGGGLWSRSNNIAGIADCNFIDNQAYQGAGLFASHGRATIQDSYFTGNFAGTAEGDVDFVAGDGAAIHCASVVADVLNCRITANEASASGGGIFLTGVDPASPTIANCLIINNEAGRDGGGISVNWFAEPTITNCTVVGNSATGEFGEIDDSSLGGGLYCSYDSNSIVTDSIFWDNSAEFGAQIAVASDYEYDPCDPCELISGTSKLSVSFSDIQGGRSAVQVDQGCTLNWGAGNIEEDPSFVGDYYLSQAAVTGQSYQSPCVDAGSTDAGNVEFDGLFGEIRLDDYTTRTDSDPDRGIVDMGYHHQLAPTVRELERCSYCDLAPLILQEEDPNVVRLRPYNDRGDGIVALEDFATVASYWLGTCAGESWCDEFNPDYDDIDFEEILSFTECWLRQDEEGPEPDQSTWEVEPYSNAPTEITMMATTAFDSWGWDVKYQFERDGVEDDWQPYPDYSDTGLTSGQQYTYRVRTRDTSPYENKSAWSVARSVKAGEDTTPPSPVGWEEPPQTNPTVTSIIDMTALEATDPEGSDPVEYYFEETSGNPGGDDRGWQTGRTHTDGGLTPDTQYCYRVRVRDSSLNQNESDWSTIACATTGEDITPPAPVGWATEPYATGATAIAMTALEATDPEGNGPVQYQFEETTGGPGGTDRGWETGRTYTDGGLNPGTEYCYRVRVRDSSPNLNESDWSATVCATTDEVDTTPPAPVDWATEPYATGTTTIVMTAAVATDPEGNGPVQYQFDETSGNPGGTDRDWGISRSHTDGSLNSGTEYCYRFRVRDGSPNQNVSDWSTTVCATTLIPNQAPYPSTGVLGEAAKWDPFAVGGEDGLPREYFWGVNDYRHYMRADTGIDFEGATVYYYFDRVGESENSGWQLSREWLVSVPAQYSPYSYTVKYGDAPTGGNVSDPCPVTLVIY